MRHFIGCAEARSASFEIHLRQQRPPQQRTQTDATTNYTWDDNGRLTQKQQTASNGNSQTTLYGWDSQDRLIEINAATR